MERPTTEVELPISGIKAVLYNYYLRGDSKAIEAIMLGSVEFKQKGSEPELKKIDVTYRARMDDKAVLLAIKELIDKDGKLPITVETLDNLPDEDFKMLQNSLPNKRPKKK